MIPSIHKQERRTPIELKWRREETFKSVLGWTVIFTLLFAILLVLLGDIV